MLAACSPQSQAPAQNPSNDEPPQTDVSPVNQTTESQTAPGEGPQTGLSQTPLTIRSGDTLHHFRVEVAASPEQQERGLMFRKSVAPDGGMIFPYNPPQQAAFWMKNTLVPLDIIFIAANRRIARITNAQPLDLTPLPSGVPVSGVLELAGGRAAELGIKVGDTVRW